MSISKIITYVILWRGFLFAVLFLGLAVLPLQFNFLGGGLSEYLRNPYVWSWLNFDGEHYYAIAQNGYRPLEYFFFPLYPLLIQYASEIFGKSILDVAIIGIVLSNLLFVVALFGLVKLINLDYKPNVAKSTVLLLLLFPTSFYFGSFYTESLFLAEVVWAMYFARKGNWILAGILAAFATGTRIVGVALLPAFIIEGYLKEKKIYSKEIMRAVLACLIGSLGIVGYMIFLERRTGNPLEFMTSLNAVFGAQRSDTLVLLPQVLYRYFIKILPNINYNYFPQVFTTLMEIGTGLLFLALSIYAFVKMRLSYAVYLASAYIIPTLSGSFSSFPRYTLALFPGFILLAMMTEKLSKTLRIFIYVVSGILLSIATTHFVRGYWVS